MSLILRVPLDPYQESLTLLNTLLSRTENYHNFYFLCDVYHKKIQDLNPNIFLYLILSLQKYSS